MSLLNLKTTHKPIQAYYQEISQLGQLHLFAEGNVSPAFASLLRHCAHQMGWKLVEKYPIKKPGSNTLYADGAIVDWCNLVHGIWEAKDIKDDLESEVKKKFAAGYPRDNILFQTPEHAIIYQDGQQVLNDPITKPEYLVEALKIFLGYNPPKHELWLEAVEEFKTKVPQLGEALLEIIGRESRTNPKFAKAFTDFTEICRNAINPNLSKQAIEEMLIQHLLTERIFRKVFNNPDFGNRNIIAREIEKVIHALTSRSFSRQDFLKRLDRFYYAIEDTAATIDNYAEKQFFLNAVYEKFFQGFSVKVADTHGIVYTPQPVVNFMVNSVEYLLQNEFGRSLSDKDVHILDPFVGTGNFIINIMRKMKKTSLPYKYANELHCNEIMLLPYYIAAMNIEHEYFELTNEYRPFDGICLVDTFELAEPHGPQFAFMTAENTERVEKLKRTKIFVVIGNPPYNVGQINENDNNKNRKYKIMDQRVRETYAKDSKATNKNALSDVYVKAYRWASDKIAENKEGIVAFVTNNGFVDDYAFDGMRKHLLQDFDKIYHINLKGNARTSGERRKKEAGNIFDDTIRVGIGITFLVKIKDFNTKKQIRIYSINDYFKAVEKKTFLDAIEHLGNVTFKNTETDDQCNWIIEDIDQGFDTLTPIGTKETKRGDGEAIFKNYGRGVATCRDAWCYNYNKNHLSEIANRLVNTYNQQVLLLKSNVPKSKIDEFVISDNQKISWSEGLKNYLYRRIEIEYEESKIRKSLYRPFSVLNLYFDKHLNERRYQFPKIFPTFQTEQENRVICLTAPGNKKSFHCLMVNIIPDLHLTGDSQCFPFYVYKEDGTNRTVNITDWALKQFRQNYKDDKIDKWNIFYYVYGILHHPQYREKYQANLYRELPRIPFAPDFWGFTSAGQRLAELHVNYENQKEFPLDMVEDKHKPLDWRVEKMKFSKDKTRIIYNDFLTLRGIPPETFEYRLGNLSALEWIVEQYRIKTDKRSGIVNDPNRQDEPDYIVKLIKRVITISLETVKIINGLPKLND